MIDRTFLPRAAPMTEWPDWDSASPRDLCAPISATVESPRGSPRDTGGHKLSPEALAARDLELRRLRKKPPRTGKWA